MKSFIKHDKRTHARMDIGHFIISRAHWPVGDKKVVITKILSGDLEVLAWTIMCARVDKSQSVVQ